MPLTMQMKRESGPLSWWIPVGPLLLMSIFALLVITKAPIPSLFAPCIMGGFIATWRWRLNGAMGGIASLALLMGFTPFSWWWAGLCLTAALSQFVTALSLTEGEVAVEGEKEKVRAAAREAQVGFEDVQSKLLAELRHKEEQIESLGAELSQAHTDVASFQRLVFTAQEEVERLSEHHHQLLESALEHERRQGEIRILKEELAQLESLSDQRLKELNEIRPSFYELQLR